jgi:hypothetical protein
MDECMSTTVLPSLPASPDSVQVRFSVHREVFNTNLGEDGSWPSTFCVRRLPYQIYVAVDQSVACLDGHTGRFVACFRNCHASLITKVGARACVCVSGSACIAFPLALPMLSTLLTCPATQGSFQ